ncbi:hypothetical protein JCM15519_13710 [Fundidesulfovibrio butyratiphilus]
MLLRERAWDVMRTDFLTVREDMNLRETAKLLLNAMKEQAGAACAVVTSATGEYRGVVTAWWLLLFLEKSALEDSLLLFSNPESDDDAFRVVCRKSFSRLASEVVERDVPVLRPQDTLSMVLEAMLATKRRWAVVMEGERVLGVISAEDVFLQMESEIVRE